MRANFTAYDATYIALSDVLGATFVTHDRRLASAARQYVEVEFL